MAAILKSYLQSQKYHDMDWDAFKLHYQTNPAYPGLRAITDTLDHFDVAHLAANVPKESFEHLPGKFVAYMLPEGQEEIVLATGRKHAVEVERGNGSTKKLDHEAFLSAWTGNVLIIEENDRPLSMGEGASTLGWWMAGMASVALVAWQSGWLVALYHSLSVAGLYLAWLAYEKSLGRESDTADKICHALGTGSGCNKLLDDKSGMLWGIVPYATAALWYFASMALIIPLLGHSTAVMAVMAMAQAPIVATSLWAQVRRRTWCGLCLGILAVLLGQAAIAAAMYQGMGIDTAYLMALAWAGAVVYLALRLLAALVGRGKEADSHATKLLKLKKSDGLFDTLLHRSTPIALPNTPGTLWFGAGPNAQVAITGFTSPTCGYCQRPFLAYHSLLAKQGGQVGLALVLSAPHTMPDNISTRVAVAVLHLYQHDKAMAWEALLQWYHHRDEATWWGKYAAHSPADSAPYLAMLEANAAWATYVGLQATPTTLLDGYKYPKEYDIEDMLWLVPARAAKMEMDGEAAEADKELQIL